MDSNVKYNQVVILCHASSNCCPVVHVSNNADEMKQVMITDDFGGKIYISLAQLTLLKDTSI